MSSTDTPTLEQVYELLKSLAEYVMNQVPTRREVMTRDELDERFGGLEARLAELERRLDEKADKKDVEQIYTILDGVIQRLDELQIEQKATNAAFVRLEERVARLEQHVGLVREAVAEYGKRKGM